MNRSYTPAQFTKGLREMRDEERGRIVRFLFSKLPDSPEADRVNLSEFLLNVITDIKAGEADHPRYRK